MRNIRLVVIVFTIFISQGLFGQNKNMVHLKGSVKNFSNQVQLEDMSEMRNLNLQALDKIIELDSLNNFSVSFQLDNPQYFRIGRNILYLSPGDSLFMLIDRTWQDSSVFEGVGSEANNYLKYTPFPKAGSFLEAGDNIKKSVKQTVIQIEKMAESREASLQKCATVSNRFRLLEKARIQSDIINSLIMITTYFLDVNKLAKDSIKAYRESYQSTVIPYINLYVKHLDLDPSYLQLGVYRQIVQSLLSRKNQNSNNRRVINDWIRASDLVDKIVEIKGRENVSWLYGQIRKISTSKYRNAALNTFNQMLAFKNGDKAKDFVMVDISKTSIPLSSFSGKVIYIDIWATWCLPCIAELPSMDTLKAKFKDNKDIVFITLSIDSDVQKWKNTLKQKNDYSNQYIIDRIKLESYRVTEIPRVIIINKAFEIEAMNAALPSSINTLPTLEKLLSK